jgi:hypothetical protein
MQQHFALLKLDNFTSIRNYGTPTFEVLATGQQKVGGDITTIMMQFD